MQQLSWCCDALLRHGDKCVLCQVNCRFWAIVCGAGLMAPLVLLPGYKALEQLSLGAVVAVLFTAVVVSAEVSLYPALWSLMYCLSA